MAVAGLTTIAQGLDRMDSLGDAPAIIAFAGQGQTVWSFARTRQAALAVAAGIHAMGGPAVVGLMADASPPALAAALGVMLSGAALAPIDVQAPPAALAHMLEDSGLKLLFLDRPLARRLEGLPQAAGLRLVFLDDDPSDGWQALPRPSEAPPAPGPGDMAALFYTSGTTGNPKGVPLTQANLAFQARAIAAAGLVRPQDRVLMPLPLHHVYPLVVGVLTPMCLGVPIILPAGLTGPMLAQAIAQGQATVVAGVPRLYRALWEGISSKAGATFASRLAFRALLAASRAALRCGGLSLGKMLFAPLHRRLGPGLRLMASGGALLDQELAWSLESLGWRVAIGYGLTETSPLLTIKAPGDLAVDSVGRPVEGVELRLAEDVPGGGDGKGEVQARGPGVFSGYLHLPDKSAAAFTADGWFRTGDLGSMDAGGRLRIHGRVGTMLVTEGGENVAPEDIEEALEAQPFVKEAAVVSLGGRLAALVVPDLGEMRKAHEGDADAAVRRAVAEAARHMPSYRRPAEVRLTREPLPRTRLGKLRRHLLADLFRQALGHGAAATSDAGPMPEDAMSVEDRGLLDHPAAGSVWRLLARRYPDKGLTPDLSPQVDLGVDSLEWLTLTLEIREAASVELTDEAVGRIETVRDLLREAVAAEGAGKAARNGLAGNGPSADPLREPELILDHGSRRWLEPAGPLLNLPARAWYALLWAFMRLYFRLGAQGRETLPPPQTRYVVAPNHASYLDAFALLPALGFGRSRQLFFAGWTGAAFANAVFRHFARLAQAVPIDPQSGIRKSLAYGAAALRSGHGLAWFPEGRRSPDGSLLSFRPGLGRLLAAYPSAVVPTYIAGTHRALPVGGFWPRPARITVRFGRPVAAAELEREGSGATAEERIMDALRRRVAELGEEMNKG